MSVKLKIRVFQYFPLLLAMVLYGYLISPVLRSGYIEDDRFDSIWAVTRKTAGVSAFEDGIYWTRIYTSELGRFHPAAHILGATSFEITDIHTFKVISYLTTLFAVFLVGLFITIWSNRKEIAVFYLLVLSSISQFRIGYDPILSFGLHTKILVILFGFQLLVVVKIKKDQNPRISVYFLLLVLLVCSGLYHEMSMLLILALLPLALAFTGRKKIIVLILVSWTFITYLFVRVPLYFAKNQNGAFPIYDLQLSPLAILKTYIQQLSGLVPFMSTRDWGQVGWENYAFAAGVVIPAFAVLATCLFKTTDRIVFHGHGMFQRDLLAMGFCGLLVVLGTGVATSLSVGHENIGIWWDGYINVWLMQIGLSIGIAVVIYSLWAKRSEKSLSKLTCGILCLIPLMLINMKITNDKIVDQNPRWTQNTAINGWEREQTLRAIKNGFLTSGTNRTQLMSLPPRIWMSNAYLETFSSNVIPLSNSWERFAPMPLNVLRGCREEKKVPILSSFERIYTCQSARGIVTSSLATSFSDGYSITGVPEQISVSDDPMTEQFRANKSQSLIRNISLFVSGKYERCKTLDAIGNTGKAIKFRLIQTSRDFIYLINPTRAVDLNSLKLSDCD